MFEPYGFRLTLRYYVAQVLAWLGYGKCDWCGKRFGNRALFRDEWWLGVRHDRCDWAMRKDLARYCGMSGGLKTEHSAECPACILKEYCEGQVRKYWGESGADAHA